MTESLMLVSKEKTRQNHSAFTEFSITKLNHNHYRFGINSLSFQA